MPVTDFSFNAPLQLGGRAWGQNDPQLPPPQFAAAPSDVTGSSRSSYLDFLRRTRGQATAGPVIYNGPEQAAGPRNPNDSPVRDDVIRSLGGIGGQLPSSQQYLASLPQSMTMQFGAGSGRLAAPSMSLDRPVGHDTYQPAFQGPEQRSDHTNAGLHAYAGLLGAMTTGPESPTQAQAARSHALNETTRTNAEYGAGGLRQQEINDRELAHQRTLNQQLMANSALQLQGGVNRDTIARNNAFLRSQAGMSGGVSTASGAPANRGGGAAAIATPVAAPVAAPGGAPPVAQPPAFDPNGPKSPEEELAEAYRSAVTGNVPQESAAATTPGAAMAGQAHAPRLQPGMNAANRAALTAFINLLPQSHFTTPESVNRLRDFVIHPDQFGQERFDRWFRENTGGVFAGAQDTLQRQAIERLAAARNRLDPANPIAIQPNTWQRLMSYLAPGAEDARALSIPGQTPLR